MTGTALAFAWRLAWRETRAAWRGFLWFFLCVTLGVGALAAVGTLATNLERTIGREARALLGGDVEVRATHGLGAAVDPAVARLAATGAGTARVRELVGMARAIGSGRTLLVEVKAVDPAYPLYGRLETTPAGESATPGGVVVGADLLGRLGVRVGDRIALGETELVVRGVISREPDRPASMVNLGPRVLMTHADLDRTGLVRHGSRVRYRTLLRLPDGADAREARDRIAAATSEVAVRVVTFDDAQPGLRKFFRQMTIYLGLVGLVSLLVGGIGVASAVATFLRRRLATIAILKTLGAESRVLLLAYLLQTALLGLGGSLVGALLGALVQPLVVLAFAGLVPFELDVRPDAPALGRAVLMGVLVTLLSGLWPLVRLRGVKPSLILRSQVEPDLPGARRPWLVAAPIVTGLAALAFWQAGSLKIGAIFVGASLAALVLLAALGRAVSALARSARFATGPAVRHGLANLHRPGGQTGVVVVALGVGVMLLVAVELLETSLLSQMDHERRRDAPSFFFVDVQADQRDRFEAIVREASGARPELTPVVRGRLAAIDGVPVTRAVVERRPDDRRWYFTRDYVLTSTAELPATNVILRGQWWEEAQVRSGKGATGTEGHPGSARGPAAARRGEALTAVEGHPGSPGGPRATSDERPPDRSGGGATGTEGHPGSAGAPRAAAAAARSPDRSGGGATGVERQDAPPRLSIEAEAAAVLGVDVGNRMTFDVQGVPIEAEVASVRRVDWQSLTLNFFVIFSPGTLEGAPTSWVGTARVPAEREAAVQDAVVSALPNVTAIPVRDVLERVAGVLDQVALAIRAVALFSIATGLVVMLGALAASRYQRLYESVILRTIGASRATVARTFAVEYGCLGAAAGLGGTALAALLAWIVLRFVFSVPWIFAPAALGLGVAVTTAAAIAVGFLATFRLLGEKPLAILRQE